MEHKYEIKNLIDNIGHDFQGYQCSLYKDNKRVATCSYDGWGSGEPEFHFLKQEFSKNFFKEIKEIKKIELSKGEKSKFMYSCNGEKKQFLFSVGIFIEELINDYIRNREIKKKCKSNILFQIDDMIDTDNYYTLKGKFSRDKVAEFLNKKYPNQKIRIINDEFDKNFK